MDELLAEITRKAVDPALEILPQHLDTDRARVMLLAIGLQESGLEHRWQIVDRNRPEIKGPARGLEQFELGSKAEKGGVWGVYLHRASHELLRELCRSRNLGFEPRNIWGQLERDDVLAMGVARLLLLTDPQPLPAVDDQRTAWKYYLRTWRPGKPKSQPWPGHHERARHHVVVNHDLA